MRIVDESGLPKQRGASAYLVAWMDRQGRIFDAGVYSEQTPTSRDMHRERSVCLLTSVSRVPAAVGGYGRAERMLRAAIAQTPSLHWVYGMRTFALSGQRMPPGRRLLAVAA
jgi:hypothetical protein